MKMTVDVITAEEASTIPGLLLERANRTPEALAYREYDQTWRRWQNVSWRQVLFRCGRFTTALAQAGLQPGERVGILLGNGVDWVCFDMAAMQKGFVVVPLYAHDSPSNHAYILKHAGVRLLLVDDDARWQAIVDIGTELPDLDQVWLRNAESQSHKPSKLKALSSLIDDLTARAFTATDIVAKPTDLATIIYTSGTTGAPKGVMLTHAAILRNAEGITRIVSPLREDIFLSILPLAHAFERTMGYYLPIMGGASVAYARSLLRFREDMRIIRPTILLAVPRLYEQVSSAIQTSARQNALKRVLVDFTVRIGWHRFQAVRGREEPPGLIRRLAWLVLQRLVARPIMAALGGRLRIAVSGGAALPEEVARFLIGLGLPLVEGYGLTETAPVVTATNLEDYLPGSVGFPLPGIEIRLDTAGELYVRSPCMMQGYWRNDEATSQVLDNQGWLQTGDLAEIRDGRVYMIGRSKELLVLSNGENVNPIPIEHAITSDPLFDQACVVGDGKPNVAAVVVLNRKAWAEQAAAWEVDQAAPNQDQSRRHILRRVKTRLKQIPEFAQVHAVHLELEPWTIESELMTPTLKVRRKQVITRYGSEIESLYRRSS